MSERLPEILLFASLGTGGLIFAILSGLILFYLFVC